MHVCMCYDISHDSCIYIYVYECEETGKKKKIEVTGNALTEVMMEGAQGKAISSDLDLHPNNCCLPIIIHK